MDNETLRGLAARKSVRVFTEQAVSQALKAQLLDAAAQAPTAGNQQLYAILDITDAAVKARLAVLCDNQPFIETAPVAFVFVADCVRWQRMYALSGCEARAPGVGDLMLAVSDAVIAAQNVVVAAESLGLGSCYIGDVMERCADMRALLHLPKHVFPCAMLVLGYPTAQQRERAKPPRFDKEMFVYENRYQLPEDEQLIALLTKRQRRAGAPEFDFDRFVRAFCARKYASDFSMEMSRSVAEYLSEFE